VKVTRTGDGEKSRRAIYHNDCRTWRSAELRGQRKSVAGRWHWRRAPGGL